MPTGFTPRLLQPTVPWPATCVEISSTSTAYSPSPLVRNGYAIVPDGPGLGVELDEDAVCYYEVR